MKRLLTLLLCLVLLFCCTGTASALDRFSHFLALNEWEEGMFSDVSASDWFYESVVNAYRMGLISGNEDGSFAPSAEVMVGQALKFASRIYRLYTTADSSFEEGDPWYRCYVDYALENGIINQEFDSYTRPITRAEFATVLFHCLPPILTPAINTVENSSIPDVPYSVPYAGAVYSLYRAGVLNGSDESGLFHPDSPITRAEAVTVVSRLLLDDQRKSLLLTAEEKAVLTGEEIYANCSNAVFYVGVDNAAGEHTGGGSGFFINSDGVGVTCWHVLQDGVSASITLKNGETHQITGLYDYSVEDDWAIFQVDGSGFEYLEIGDRGTNIGGATVYALGSPLGIPDTITTGMISNPFRYEEGVNYILISAPISHGSSGGPLINKYGEAIGIVAATYVYGQNLNLALNITYLDRAMRSATRPLSEIIAELNLPALPETPVSNETEG